ncbi:TetR family transcriptional regulator [Mycolicibacterium mucogenicum]|uniref:TetR family transcriptional regulator n=1 Tax=Mycolicibacterium mucogenicum DSM 44124 TaxID=1226753 RepID=A0A8H2PH96_MYCMU|nr:TetR family transcriptional regulator [Mycolicibacterium mucogenicum]KAB7760753.1 TetR family transcriptional regulator [Mycolicibacterium mucogenicum DSM 44124]QPG67938.1 TetR family transcriptional regulator [Mycolicibacterium mucogenicum DSM 44124]
MSQRPTRGGRRPGPSGTREAIEETARKLFAELGYERTSLRQIALQAGVDPALVSHFYGKKRDLFLAVVELPVEPATVIGRVLDGDKDSAGLRLATFILEVLDDEVRRQPMIGMVRAATAEPEAAKLVRDFLARNIIAPIAEGLGSADADYRAALVMSQVNGFAMARYVIGLDPLANRSNEQLAADLGVTLQRYLLGDLAPGR